MTRRSRYTEARERGKLNLWEQSQLSPGEFIRRHRGLPPKSMMDRFRSLLSQSFVDVTFLKEMAKTASGDQQRRREQKMDVLNSNRRCLVDVWVSSGVVAERYLDALGILVVWSDRAAWTVSRDIWRKFLWGDFADPPQYNRD